jgi:hypothetical protein
MLAGVILCASLTSGSMAQTVRVAASGTWDMANIKLEEARRLALDNAKADALRRAGIPEEFIVVNAATVSDRINGFASYSNSELSGEIVNYRIISDRVENEGSRYFYLVSIEATVKTGRMRRDLEFDAFINGIRQGVYRDGEALEFDIRPTKDCYVHIFWFDASGRGNLVYPNQAEPTERLDSDAVTSFPRTQRYRVRKEDAQAASESVSLLFAFTKKKVPFTNECTFENVQRWIQSIPAHERKVKYNALLVTD